ncbi:ATP-dependent 6-phosphofructokinase [bacterium]|nr:ATP-dependent 6-phosphofructokinase [bacterium]
MIPPSRDCLKIGVLTGGGDAPGLNAVVRAIVKSAICEYGSEIVGILNGFGGLLSPPSVRPLSLHDVRGLVARGGTVLGTTLRANPFAIEGKDRSKEVLDSVRWLGLDGLVVIGGQGSLTIAHRFSEKGLKVVGVPKTIDNELAATSVSFGFNTAVATASDAIDKLQTTAESHHRVMFIEVMGRSTGWIALASGISGGADVILIPEIPYRIERIVEKIHERKLQGREYTIVVVAEGAFEEGGSPSYMGEDERKPPEDRRLIGAAERVARAVGAATGLDWRVTVLGHLQRGGVPTPHDRILATRFGAGAVRAVQEKAFGKMVAIDGAQMHLVPLAEAISKVKRVSPESELVWTARALGISLGAQVAANGSHASLDG